MQVPKDQHISGKRRGWDPDAIARGHREYMRKIRELRREKQRDVAAQCMARFESIQRTRIRNAKARNAPDQTRALLVILATQLRDGEALQYEAREYLANALLCAAKIPCNAAAALGLVRSRGNPARAGVFRLGLAVQVLELSCKHAIYSARNGPSAVELVANNHHVSVEAVVRAWKQWGGALREHARDQAEESDQ